MPSVPHLPQGSNLHGPFGTDRFGQAAERFARFFGTPKFILGQTLLVAMWIALNAVALSLRWDPYPFILLNLAFSTQAAYAAPPTIRAPGRGLRRRTRRPPRRRRLARRRCRSSSW